MLKTRELFILGAMQLPLKLAEVYVAMLLWNWFMTVAFHTPMIGYGIMLGIETLYTLFTFKPNLLEQKLYEEYVVKTWYEAGAIAIALLIGFIVHLFA